MKLPIISLAILGGQAFGAWEASGHQLPWALNEFTTYYTGFSPLTHTFHPQNLLVGYAPWIIKRFLLPIARPKIGGMHLPVSLS